MRSYALLGKLDGAEVAMGAALLDRIVIALAIVLISQVGLWKFVRPALAAGGGRVADEAGGDGGGASGGTDG